MIDELAPYPAMKNSGVPWLGAIPASWSVVRNGRLFVERKETGFADLPILEVSLRSGVRVRRLGGDARKQLMADRDKYKRACAGDLAYNMMRMWQGAVGLAPVDSLVSPAYVVARPFGGVDARYFAYLFRTDAYMGEVDQYSHGIVKDRNRLYWDQFKQMPSACPPAEEQAAIVRFLAHADRQIGRYVQAKQRLIALLEEQKQAIIHLAVTRGLDPSVHLKPSGVEWLGQVPEGWEVTTLRRVISRAVDGPHHSPTYVDVGIPFLSARNIKADRWSLDDVKFISEEDYADFSKRIAPETGDVLYTKGGTTGVARAVDLRFRFQVWVHVAVLKVKRAKVVPTFLATALNSRRCYEQAQLFTRGATNQDLGLSRMKDIVFPLPTMAEQEEILLSIDTDTHGLRSAVKCAQREISLVREYRTRLVADIVTGKLDVREAAATLPDEADETEPLDDTAAREADDAADDADRGTAEREEEA